ncbi:Ferric-chelate reductase (NADH) [Bertholletia excelsa]
MVRRMTILLVFVGWVLSGLCCPQRNTNIRGHPLNKKLNSTYFQEQGCELASPFVLILYMFPNCALFYRDKSSSVFTSIMLIAAMGCVYLHFQKSFDDGKSTSIGRFLSFRKRPLIVMAPLGIVSATELAFAAIFLVLLIWSLPNYLHVSFGHLHMHKVGEKVWEAKLKNAGLLLGLCGNICVAFLFFPVTRGSSVLRLAGLTSESSIKYHIWLGHITMTLFTAHGLCYIFLWAHTHELSLMLKWDKVGISNVAGEVALLSGLAMWATSFPRIRRRIFELFFYTHYLYILFVVFFVFHVGFSYFCITLPGFYLFLIDRFLRFLQSQQKVRLVSARVLPCEAVELNFSKSPGLRYNPTSTVFINMPGISRLQWHPFTITSNCNTDTDKLSVVIKSEGSWTQTLYQKLSQPSPVDQLEVSVEGPYGPPSTHFLRHDALVMVSGGSGITPFISIIRELLHSSSLRSCRTQQVLLITAFKKSEDLAMLDLLLPISGTGNEICDLQLRIEAYVTREKEPISADQKTCRTVWFLSSPKDAPVSAVLGSNSWLWLGVIISSSFVTFLVILGIMTRFYIYPIDHNTNLRFPSALRAGLNMLFVCVSIAMASTAAFIWIKKQSVKEMRQIQSLETPVMSPGAGSWFYNGDRELESLPHQSIVEDTTKVHYGERPNLKKLISECEGDSIGVLVSGPKKMRQEVAAICSSSGAENLHFESISFSW